MKPNFVKIGIMAISTVFFFSCFSKKTVPNDVFIRVENKTNYDFREVLLGKRIIKTNSYKNKSYESKFFDVAKNSITEYKNTIGKHVGYSRMRLSKNPSGHLNVPVSHIQKQVQKANSFSDPFENPFSEELIDGFSLNKGYYTFVISEKNKIGHIEIRKDDT